MCVGTRTGGMCASGFSDPVLSVDGHHKHGVEFPTGEGERVPLGLRLRRAFLSSVLPEDAD